jgi:predicted CoA-substrate-specific enzyme activase
MYCLGINIGSVSVKYVYLDNNKFISSGIIPHDGNIKEATESFLKRDNFHPETISLVTGNEGRLLLDLPDYPEIICVERLIKDEPDDYSAVVSMGGEDIIVYAVDENRNIYDTVSGNKCATGTGEFFKQQLGRMNLSLDDLKDTERFVDSKAQKLSKRCSVFMKSDCTHRLNKGQASKEDIVLSLCYVMASKIAEYLGKARISRGKILLAGGLSNTVFIKDYLQEMLPNAEFIVNEKSLVLEAWGAALLASEHRVVINSTEKLFVSKSSRFKTYPSLKESAKMIEKIQSEAATPLADSLYVLGIDGGSTTTKACLVDYNTKQIVASYYNRTHGDPVKSLIECIQHISNQIAVHFNPEDLKINLISTTGSSRELLGLYTGTQAIYNEILAHGKGTSHYCGDIDTIFEIGGQDAKYIYLQNDVAVDYAMNEACSAGTGSFLEEAASGDLNIKDVRDIGDIALDSDAPVKFSEHCSAFINAEIRKAIVQGYSKADITAGLVVSIVSNYLNRVVGNRKIGNNITIQGGVAKNPAIPAAFAMLLNKSLIIPPMPELLGCFGTALIAIEKHKQGLLEDGRYNLDEIISTHFKIEKYVDCKACENICSIAVINVRGEKKMFGGRCSKYTLIKNKNNSTEATNYVAEYRELLFLHNEEKSKLNNTPTIGIPLCFSVYNLFPLYKTFFEELGCQIVLSDNVDEEGSIRVESDYCFPAEIAHGAVYNIIKKQTDYIFLPHFKEQLKSETYYKHSCLCPITQALPYYISKAFTEIDSKQILSPLISLSDNNKHLIKVLLEIAITIGFSKNQGQAAINNATKKQAEFEQKLEDRGKQVAELINNGNRPSVLLLGRPYNAFTKDANMGIPDKFVKRGVDVIPFNMIGSGKDHVYENMYWLYGRQVLEAAKFADENKNFYPVYITNFSCAPDSFLLHYLAWIMKSKPYLILELDSHTADAGIDTRIEAFLDIVQNYHNNEFQNEDETFDNGLRFITNSRSDIHIKNIKTNEIIQIRNNKKTKMLLSNMGRFSTELVSAFLKQYGISAYTFPLADEFTVQLAKSVSSGKECLPSHLVLGSFLQFLSSNDYKKDEIYLLFVPTTTGPCRTGQYFVFYEKIIKDLKIDNVVVITLDSDNSYNEFGKGFSKNVWWALVIADYLKDIETVLRTCAEDSHYALDIFEKEWKKLVVACEESVKNTIPQLKTYAEVLSGIPLKYDPSERKKILIIGEIYVRRDDFAVSELIQIFASKGIISKISGISEWIYYCDYVRKQDIQNTDKGIVNRTGKNIIWSLENKYKHNIEKKVKEALSPSGLLVEFPDNMDEIMQNCTEQFIGNELYSEISVSGGMAYTALNDGFAGVVNISPFACLIGRVIEGIVKPWARENRKSLISVEVDGNPLPINTLNKLDAFTANVLRDKT